MKKLWKLGAAIAVIALLFAVSCGGDDSKPAPPAPPTPTDPAITGIALKMTIDGYDYTSAPQGLKDGTTAVFTATVSGTDGTNPTVAFNPAYTITVTADVEENVEVTGNGTQSVTVEVANPTVEGTLTVTATSAADSSKTATWTLELDPAGGYSLSWATGIKLYVAATETGAENYTKPEFLLPGSTWWFGATVEGLGPDWIDTYEIGAVSVPADLIEVSGDTSDRIKVEIDEEEGTITVTATADELDQEGEELPAAVWIINVAEGPAGNPFENAQWKLLNTAVARGVTLNASTTTSVPAPVNNRYVIFNNEPGALIDANETLAVTGDNTFKDVTLLYLDTPFVFQAECFAILKTEVSL